MVKRILLVVVLLLTHEVEAATGSSPNLLRNARFLECANPGVPDWWGTGAPENIEKWTGCYVLDADAPFPGMKSLRLTSPDATHPISVQSYAYTLPVQREYTFSVYLKALSEGVKSTLTIGDDRSKSFAVMRDWQRYSLTATPVRGHWGAGRLVVRFSIDTPGTLLVAAPQLEYGNQATEFRPADADVSAGKPAAAEPSIPPNPLPLPSARCAATKAPPVIDGRLDDPCYQTAAKVADFREMSSGRIATVQTECFVLRDTSNLYIAFRCLEPQMSDIVATVRTRDGAVFGNDSVEVFMQPDARSPEYLHFAVNTLGTRYDEKQYDTLWNAEWQAVTAKGEREWTVEIALPFAQLGLTPRTQSTWRVNFCRNRPHGSDARYSQWSCTYIGFHVPSRFGKLGGFRREDLQQYFAEPPKTLPSAPPPQSPFRATFEYSYYTSEPTARLWVKSNLDTTVEVSIILRSRSTSETLHLKCESASLLVPPGSSRFIPYHIAALPVGEYIATVAAYSGRNEALQLCTTSLVKLPPAATEVKIHRVQRSLVVNGKPLIVNAQGIHGMRGGWWLDDIASHGFNAVVASCGAYSSDEEMSRNEPRIRSFLDECQHKKLWVIMWLHPGSGPYPPIREAVVRTITRLKDHPAIVCWYLVDEPEGWWSSQEGGKKEEDLVDLYLAAKAADPYRPSHINWYSWSKGKGGYGSLNATDVGCVDHYPVGRGNAAKKVGNFTSLMNEDCRPRFQPTAFWVQMYGYDDAIREPTPAEMKAMTYVSLIDGMRLIYYFIYKPMSVDLWESMKGLGEELRRLESVLTTQTAEEVAGGIEANRVHYCLWRSGDKHYLIACNVHGEATHFVLNLKRFILSDMPRTASVWFERTPVRLRGGKVEAVLTANQCVVVELR